MDLQTGVIRGPAARMRPGFTMIELVLVLTIGGILTAVAVPPMTSYVQNRHVMQARDSFIMMAAQARASAMEEGDIVLMAVTPATDSVVVTRRDGTVLHVLDLRTGDRRADLLGDPITLCYTTRGYAHQSCLDGGSLPASFGFANDTHTVWADLTLGQAVRQ